MFYLPQANNKGIKLLTKKSLPTNSTHENLLSVHGFTLSKNFHKTGNKMEYSGLSTRNGAVSHQKRDI